MIQQIGNHKVRHGNVMDDLTSLMHNEKADIFYSDPPWGNGNLKYWQTMNQKHNPGAVRRDTELVDFLTRIFSLAEQYAKNIVIIEYGIRWEAEIIEMGKRHGLIHLGLAESLYGSGSKMLPLHVHIFAKRAIHLPDGYLASIAGTNGMATVRAAASPFRVNDGIVMDPCCGLGNSARIALELGMRFRGNELNIKRLGKTIEVLAGAIK